jgi:hypothetical protein
MLEMRQFEQTDLAAITYRDGDDYSVDLEKYAAHGDATTFLINGEPVAALGCVLDYPGVAMTWALISEGARGHGIALTKATKEVVEGWIELYGLHRLHCLVTPSKEEYVRWIEAIGFEKESLMKHVTPDKQDMFLYVILRV